MLVSSFVHHIRGIYFKVLRQSFSCGVYLTNRWSESIHIWNIGTLEGLLPCHEFWPLGSCPGVGLEVKIKDIFKKCFSTFLLWKQLVQIMETTYADSCSDMAQPCDIDYISRFSDFALYLEDYLMYEHHSLG